MVDDVELGVYNLVSRLRGVSWPFKRGGGPIQGHRATCPLIRLYEILRPRADDPDRMQPVPGLYLHGFYPPTRPPFFAKKKYKSKKCWLSTFGTDIWHWANRQWKCPNIGSLPCKEFDDVELALWNLINWLSGVTWLCTRAGGAIRGHCATCRLIRLYAIWQALLTVCNRSQVSLSSRVLPVHSAFFMLWNNSPKFADYIYIFGWYIYILFHACDGTVIEALTSAVVTRSLRPPKIHVWYGLFRRWMPSSIARLRVPFSNFA